MRIFLGIGSGSGIGFATASHFAEKGFKIILTSRIKQNLEGMTKQLQNRDFDAQYEILDASDPIAIQHCIDKIIMQYGSVDVIHYNAASMREQSLDKQPLDTLISDLSVNIGGGLLLLLKHWFLIWRQRDKEPFCLLEVVLPFTHRQIFYL